MRLWVLLWLLKSGNNQTSLLICISPSSSLMIGVCSEQSSGISRLLWEAAGRPSPHGGQSECTFWRLHGPVHVFSIRLPSDPCNMEIMTLPKGLLPRAESFFFTCFRKSLRELKRSGKEAMKIKTLIIRFGTLGNKRNLLRLDFSYSWNDFKFFYRGYKLQE